MSITIKDIAKMLNVSHTTVSRSLNDSSLISKETKERVKEVAKKYNYRPNVSARSLVLAKSYNIGLFFSTLKTGTTANFFLNSVRGVNSIIKGRYNLAVEAVDDLIDFQQINPRSFDGIIVMSQSPNDDEFIAHVLREEIPLVVLNREVIGQKVTSVLSDDLKGAYNLTKFIIDQGHRDIAIIEGKPEFRTTYKRKQGFINAHLDAGLEFSEGYALRGKYDLESGYSAMQIIFDMEEPPTAIFCSNDEMALGAMKAIKERDITMPDEISIAGFDDMGFTAYLTPSLTTVLRPVEEMSKEGTQILLNKIENSKMEEPGIIHLDTKLIIRDSVKKIN
ncbi:MAG: LacI family DNA-binding transcriptional regulator [Cyclobacteriaceae bacterium]|nr:LacI family DNA-binding transcriptional regulator [Cyclobacteriaceae bacterium]MCK5368550.1 LacI family DNA-binding transcriptional regulator [Cyclobacteriaceae bacterium]MCK5469373.1 LacI family DNA-binding transcriptional regulator [Cyclobacteriaceae bacterium]